MAKASRPSLGNFTPVPVPPAAVDGARVDMPAAAPQVQTSAVTTARKRRPASLTVYLPPDLIKTLKLIGLEHDRRITDICEEAITEWLRSRGHLRGELFTVNGKT